MAEAASFDKLYSIDALPFAPDRPAALAEIRRVLKPGGKLVATVWEETDTWRQDLVKAGLTVADRTEAPEVATRFEALYAQWLANEDQLRGEVTDGMINEARRGTEKHRTRTYLFVTASRSAGAPNGGR